MRTSHLQYVKMVEFMESNGDLSKHSGGSRDRQFIQTKWEELTKKLNSIGTGNPRSEEKWRKVWSDFKNNCKKKRVKLTRAARDTGSQLSLTDLEERVIQIIGLKAVTGIEEEAGFQQDKASGICKARPVKSVSDDSSEIFDIVWNTPGTSTQPSVVPPAPPMEAHHPSFPVASMLEDWKPPHKKTKQYLTRKFIANDKKARQYAGECDTEFYELEKERLRIKAEELRVREFEVQERVRQRDVELRLQAQLQEIIKETMEVVVKFIEKKS